MIHFTVFQRADRTSDYVGTYLAPSFDRVADHIHNINQEYGAETTRKYYPKGIERMELTMRTNEGVRFYTILPTEITVLDAPYEEPTNVQQQ